MVMEKFNATPSAENQKETADMLIERELADAKTIGDARRSMQELMQKVGTDGEVGERLQEVVRSVDKASEFGAHDNVQLEDDLGGGVLGQNKLGSKESVMRRDQLHPEQIVENTRYTMDTILHENSDELGHAGQDRNSLPTITVIDKTGKMHDSTTILEGNVVANVSARLGERREGLPQETYIEGADLVEEIGRQTVDDYVRKGGAHVGEHLQTEVWKTQPSITFAEMQQQGAALGMTEEQVKNAAEEQGKLLAV